MSSTIAWAIGANYHGSKLMFGKGGTLIDSTDSAIVLLPRCCICVAKKQ
ncbi:hypothetical protein O9929_12690 [Vibrio lentus]|nr:hypothetical protein [Vibrio lentus]